MTTAELCHAILQQYPLCRVRVQYCIKRCGGKEAHCDALSRKRKALHLLRQWSAHYRPQLYSDRQAQLCIQTMYHCLLEDLCQFPALERNMKDLQKLHHLHYTPTMKECTPNT
ncbi:hypothetical protein JZ751_013414, partial [Albula glossodonta]